MSGDLTVLCVREPDQRIIVGCLLATTPLHNVREVAGGSVLEVFDDGGAAVVAVKLPRLVRVGTEIGRLLRGDTVSAVPGSVLPAALTQGSSAAGAGGEAADQDCWWLDLHTAAAGNRGLAEALAHAIAGTCDGAVVSAGREG